MSAIASGNHSLPVPTRTPLLDRLGGHAQRRKQLHKNLDGDLLRGGIKLLPIEGAQRIGEAAELLEHLDDRVVVCADIFRSLRPTDALVLRLYGHQTAYLEQRANSNGESLCWGEGLSIIAVNGVCVSGPELRCLPTPDSHPPTHTVAQSNEEQAPARLLSFSLSPDTP